MSTEIFDQVKENIKQLTASEKAALVQYLLSQETQLMSKNPLENEIESKNKEEKRVFGLYPGGWISDDFNEPLPDEFWLGQGEQL